MRRNILWIILICTAGIGLNGQNIMNLTLEKTIELANDSSLEAYRSWNLYLSGYWEYRSYKAARLPGLILKMTPVQYYRDITRRYDSEQNLDVYRKQQTLNSYGNLAIVQNFDLTGGTFYIDTELGYLRSLGETNYTQFTSTPLRVGYSQSLMGYNPFKWDRKIEPLKFEKQKKQLIYTMETVAEEAIARFFELAMAQAEHQLALDNVTSTDTLYKTGMRRYEIASISQADLFTLKLDAVNAKNTLRNAEIALKRAMFALASYLNLDKNTQLSLELPRKPTDKNIAVQEALVIARKNNPTFLNLQQDILQAEQHVDKTRKESRFDITFSASIGFNQVASRFKGVYRNPLQQDLISLNISVPLIDWGVKKGKYNMAKNNLNVTRISADQEKLKVEEEVIMTVDDFNTQLAEINSSEEALELAVLAFNETKQRFMIGKTDINSLTLSLNRQQTAQRNYISALRNYWQNYYKIRRLTLYDFDRQVSLLTFFDFKH